MAGNGEVAGEQAAAARGDDEPAPTEPETSEISERQGSAADEWGWFDHSHGASRGDPSWNGWGWSHAWWGRDQAGRNANDLERRASWTSSWGNYSTDASNHSARSRSGNEAEDGFGTRDFRRGGQDLRLGGSDSEGVWRDPWADGGVRVHGWRDSPDGVYAGEWAATSRAQDAVWSGWKHFSGSVNNQDGDLTERGGAWKAGTPRPSEKLSVPVFTGEDDEDVGTSARSYLRQVEAWRRLTYLPNNQQGLVLYRHLSGKAWVAAEELNVDALSRDDGVHYLMGWLRNRYLDLEVTRIGKALSEMFRKLRRKHGQSIRDYNAEYDRLHARLKEVGCMLPEECAAWLYVDRLQLEEGAELNLLASVGNVYNLNKLQKAAIIQDRGLRKPWEGGGGKGGRKPYTAHVTDADENVEEYYEDMPEEDLDTIPEEVAVAYMTFQNAKAKYKEQARTRGYRGDTGKDSGKDAGKGNGHSNEPRDKGRDEKLRQIKARSFCSGCGRRGHWHLDDECPNNANKGASTTKGTPTREVCVLMPAQVMALKHEAGVLMGITDTACARTVAGTQWLQDYMDKLGDSEAKPELSKECEAYKFGTGRIHYSSFNVILTFALGNSTVQLRTSVIPGDIPLLLSKTVLGKLGMVYDVTRDRADFNAVGLKDFELMMTGSGHPAIPIVPTKSAKGVSTSLPAEDLRLEPREQYTVHAVAVANCKPPNLYNLYYEKKIPPEFRNVVECAKDLPISKMTKPQLLQECLRLGLTVHNSWSPEEIKAVIMEHRQKYKEEDATERMKRMSHLTMPELKAKASALGVDFPANVTKGNLLRLVRDSINTPDNELMKIGKHRGKEFREVPWEYGRWASAEVKTTANADPELISYANWWDRKEAEKKAGYMKREVDDTSRTPGAPSDATSWASVSVWEDEWPKRTTTTPDKQLPVAPNTKTKRRTQEGDETIMDAEPDQETLEEIQKLETRLAILKNKAKAKGDTVITEGDLVKAVGTQNSILAATLEPGTPFRADLPPGEQQAKLAYEQGKFTFEVLQGILECFEFKPRRNDRGEPFHRDTGEGKSIDYFTFGLFTHGGVQGVTRCTTEWPHLCRYMNAFAEHKLEKGATWSSFTLARNVVANVHHDYNNLRGSANHSCSFGQDGGGQLWLEDKDVQETDTEKTGLVWKRGAGGAWMPGRLRDTYENFVSFDPYYKHATCPWQGQRWSITYHTTRGILKAEKTTCNVLKKVGFRLPNLRGIRSLPVSKMPKKSTRTKLANVAGKLSVMMTGLLLAASSFMCEARPAPEPDPIVLFEIGGFDATYEAAELDKAVIEPMTWEDYRSPERKEDAYHFVKAANPKELRINLKGIREADYEGIVGLIREQVRGGGEAVLRGGDPKVFIEELGEYLAWNITDFSGDAWVGFRRDGQGRLFEGKGVRPHHVCVVEPDEKDEPPLRMDGSGISFDAGVNPVIQASLRRLHQNLGHPRREDLVRHLRLAGCEEAVLKAARGMRCTVCDSTAGPKIARPTTVPRMYDFNDCVGADLLHHHDCDDTRHTFLSIVDWGTSYHVAVPLDGLNNEDIEKAFNDNWVVPFGPPKRVSLDLDGAVQKGICRLCDWHGITVQNVAAQAHWQAGITERQGAWWKNIWERVCHEMSVTADEVHLAASMVSSAKNELRRRCGHSPTEWVFGRHPRLPEGLADPDSGQRVSWDVSPESQYQRAMAIRTAARIAYHHSQGDSRLRKALLQRARTAVRPMEVGETVHFWTQPKNRRRGRWLGPAVVVGREGENYWISRNGRCRLTAAEHLRPSGPEEIGEYLRMRGAQAEVEKLLEADFDNEDTYDAEEMDAEDLPVGGDDEEMEMLLGSEYAPSEPGEPLEDLLPLPGVPHRRLKRKTRAEDIIPDSGPNETLFTKKALTQRGVEKRQEKELKWAEIPNEVREKFKQAEATQWAEHLDYDALEPLSIEDSKFVRENVQADRILRSRWAYKDKNWARRRTEKTAENPDETVPWKCKARLVIAGHTDPDLAYGLSTDAPTLPRPALLCLLQRLANGLHDEDKWTAAAGDIRCAFLTGGYLKREEQLFLHQPTTGFAGLHPEQLVRVKKNIFGLATSPHEWWLDLQNGIKGILLKIENEHYAFDQCPLDPCVFPLRKVVNGKLCERPVGYVASHVDDLLVIAPDSISKRVRTELSKAFPVESWEEDEFTYLGSEIKCEKDIVTLRQRPYIEDRLFTVEIPKNVGDDDFADTGCVADNRSLIGALSWVSAQTRPDLTCSVSMAQQLQKTPTYGDVKFTNSISAKAINYKDEGLAFRKIPEDKTIFLIYHDAGWANAYECEYDEEGFELYEEDKKNGLQLHGPPSHRAGRKAKRGNSRVASQLGELVLIADVSCIIGRTGWSSILDWKSRAGQRVCRSTFSAETQACVEALEGGQFMRSVYETICTGEMIGVDKATFPLVCLSDCRSLFDHIHKEGVPRTPTDRRLAIDLAALRQSLKQEKWTHKLPLAWIPSEQQLGDILTKPQDSSSWWAAVKRPLTIPISIAEATFDPKACCSSKEVELSEACPLAVAGGRCFFCSLRPVVSNLGFRV
ncbi:RE1 [Symbiodinium sp. KB8]|nr:RE1 [Symbiodinium sp. KB8]